MRIGIDGRCLQNNKTGIGRYSFEICQRLGEEIESASFFVYTQVPIRMPGDPERWIPRVDLPYFRALKPPLWLKLRCGALCREDALDVFWATGTIFPYLHKSVRTVSTVHDLNHLLVPETMGTSTLWGRRIFFKSDVGRADFVNANSQGTSEKLLQLLGRAADAVVPPGVGDQFVPATQEKIRSILAKYQIGGPFLLAVATLEPRKNLTLLIDAFLDLKDEGLLSSDFELILAGGKGWKDSALSRKVADAGKRGIRGIGFVPDEDLPVLYSSAELFVFPSIYEGFGLPVLEARACGARIVATDIPEIREAGGEAAIYCLPQIDALKEAISRALQQPKQPCKREQLPSWKASAKILSQLLTADAHKRTANRRMAGVPFGS